ncbi:MAG: Rpn family recombination-promoting nuclease/putative transposase [Steroidobacteraceae bacterium]
MRLVCPRLPPLLLLVLYNGVRRWDAPTEISELIALSPDSALWPWQPQARYHLLDIGAFPKDDLARRASLAALLFRLEQRHPPEQIEQLLGEVIGWFRRHEGYGRLRELFAELVREALAGFGLKLPASEDLLDMKTNLSTLGETWKQQWRAEGLAEGRADGLAEGRAEGRADGLADGLIRGKAEALLMPSGRAIRHGGAVLPQANPGRQADNP